MIEIKLEQLLEKRGLTAYALSKQTGLHQSVLSKLKSNSTKALRIDVLDTICQALDCQPGDLLSFKAVEKNSRK